mgnify:CR=1 FL=1
MIAAQQLWRQRDPALLRALLARPGQAVPKERLSSLVFGADVEVQADADMFEALWLMVRHRVHRPGHTRVVGQRAAAGFFGLRLAPGGPAGGGAAAGTAGAAAAGIARAQAGVAEANANLNRMQQDWRSKAASELAEHVLHALNSIPEKMR